jgi:hypothetical protein
MAECAICVHRECVLDEHDDVKSVFYFTKQRNIQRLFCHQKT